MSSIRILKPGTEFILEAISFTHSKNIEKSAPSIQWTITSEGGKTENIGTGKTIRYKISNKYAGKKVTFRAYIKEDSKAKYPQQCLTCFVEEQVSVEGIDIKKVKGVGNAKVGDTVEYRVTEYNIDAKKITETQKKYIKWDVKIGDIEKKLLTNNKNEPFRGETIRFTIPETWVGKNILLMPYLNQSTEKTAEKLKVNVKNIQTDSSCGIAYRDIIKCTRYNKKYGPIYKGSLKMDNYSDWDVLVNNGKVTIEEKSIIIGMSANEGNLDTVQSYDSEIVAVGAMQKTVNINGYGEFPVQMAEFKNEQPEKFKQLFENCGWTVKIESGRWRAYYKNETGETLKTKIRQNCSQSYFGKNVKSIPLEPLINAANDQLFQAKQIIDFITRMKSVVLKIIPQDHTWQIKDYVKSKLGKATILDHHVNRPGYVRADFGKALDRFYLKNSSASKNPGEWGVRHAQYKKRY